MIQSSRQTARSAQPLARGHLIAAALRVLDHARMVEAHARRAPVQSHTPHLIERLASHREILARRAANVALAGAVSADELRELREAISRLVAVEGWATRKLGGLNRLS